jgi:cellulose synthase/poly-beta-1,6-N-acetylglucosamine synthase-like glycosyltransferase
MARPSVDVVVPFAGAEPELQAVAVRLSALAVREGDTVTLVDNRAETAAAHTRPPVATPGVAASKPTEGADVAASPTVHILRAPERRSSYFARNRGAAEGRAEWLLFLDADIRFDADLLDRLFATPPAPGTGVLAGGIDDEVVVDGPVARWLRDRRQMDQRNTLGYRRPYAQTAHCAVRREAFAAVGGFADDIRSGGDADLCFRLADAGWALEERPEARVRHAARARLGPLLGQLARHGAGIAWLDRRYPGTFPPRRDPAGVAWWLVRSGARGAARAARGDREAALHAVLEPLTVWAFELGRLLPNDAPTGRAGPIDRWLR